MIRPHLPLNALRAFEASARHLSFTRAAVELCVTQAAVSHQVKSLEGQLNITLFKRLPRGLMLTNEGETLLPVLRDCFDRIAQTLERFEEGHFREVLTVGRWVRLRWVGCCRGWRVSKSNIHTSTCACRPITTAWMWLPKGWITQYGLAQEPGTG
jgi:predicted transcriptional regulator